MLSFTWFRSDYKNRTYTIRIKCAIKLVEAANKKHLVENKGHVQITSPATLL